MAGASATTAEGIAGGGGSVAAGSGALATVTGAGPAAGRRICCPARIRLRLPRAFNATSVDTRVS